MLDSSAALAVWPAHIKSLLHDLPGETDQKIAVMVAAIEIENTLSIGNPKLDKWARIVKRMFETWVVAKQYLNPDPGVDSGMPESVRKSDNEVAIEYGLMSKKAVEDKQIQLQSYAEQRIQNALDQINAGWPTEEIRFFLCSKEEYRQVVRMSGRAG